MATKDAGIKAGGEKVVSPHLAALIELLRRDRQGKFGTYPDQAIYTLHDARVMAALQQRFDQGLAINSIRALQYDFYTGLHNIIFDFAPGIAPNVTSSVEPGVEARIEPSVAERSIVLVPSRPASVLVILDNHCRVIGLVDPFDPKQPNKYVPPLPDKMDGDHPFVLDRPAMAQKISVSDAQLHPAQIRNRAFFQRLQSSVKGGGAGGPIIIIIEWPILTTCIIGTWTPWYGTVSDPILDDSGKDPDIWV